MSSVPTHPTHPPQEDAPPLRIMAIVPCYNEGQIIARTLRRLREHNPDIAVVVVNDGSTDDSRATLAAIEGITVVDLPLNLGIGGAVQTGFRYFLRSDCDVVLQFDGDGQHPAPQIPLLVRPLERQECDAVIGSRFLGKGEGYRSTLTRRIGIRWFGALIRLLTGRKITDATSGFRAFRKAVVADMVNHYPDDFPEPISTVFLLQRRYRVREIAVQMEERSEGTSSLLGWRSVYYLFKVTLALFVARWSTTG